MEQPTEEQAQVEATQQTFEMFIARDSISSTCLPEFEMFVDFCKKGERAARYRKGQYFFNVLAGIRPDISEQLRGTALDPFYIDQRIPAFLDFVKGAW